MNDPSPAQTPGDFLVVNATLAIPLAEISFTADRGSGPGGQHVNKVSTRITLHFDVAGSPSLSQEQRFLIMEKLRGRISQEGELRIVAGEYRSQTANKTEALGRFAFLLRQALVRKTPRRATKPTKASKQRRLEGKKLRGITKLRRAGPTAHD